MALTSRSWRCIRRGEAAERLEPTGEVVGGQEVGQMGTEPVVALVVEAFDGGFLDGAVHAQLVP